MMSDTTVIRYARAEEITKISAVMKQSWIYAYRGIVNDAYLSTLQDDHWVDFFSTGMKDEANAYLTAEIDGRIVGLCVVSPSKYKQFPDDAEIVTLYLLPEYIGKGLGFGLYHFAKDVMQQRGYAHCVLGVLPQNKRAVDFYKKAGFVKTPFTESFQLGTQTLKAMIMRKVL
jgi:ribosomal protein S18 acetylase RimI-like enzyme